MTANRLLLLPMCLLLSLTAQASCQQTDPRRVSVVAQESKATLNALFEREQVKSSGEPSRNMAILAVYLASEGKLDAQSVGRLSRQVAVQPDDHFAKLYEGYAWVFSAEKYNKEKNYLRAAEYLKRGFFLIDEAVDSDPDNWRLRYLRMRLDAFVPSELGRYVISLKDASILTAISGEIPSKIHPFISALKASALERSGKKALAASDFYSMQAHFEGTDMAVLSSVCGLKNIVSAEEIRELLEYALSHKK